jgi:hypothetical protein
MKFCIIAAMNKTQWTKERKTMQEEGLRHAA